ncbi:Gp15 family bacteriophage protein [Listeria rocourtiae]|uniref:Gp15 family bacteriophage protein n=1 Tax=Listeria rocourtiae TaxID=647910 RepID=UPI003D2F7A30
MFSLTSKKKADRHITYRGEKVLISITFDNVIKAIKLYDDKFLKENQKIYIMYRMFVKDYKKYDHTPRDVVKITELIYKELSQTDSDSGSDLADNEELYNFFEDAERIYASFLIDYNIDLLNEVGVLSWDEFIALFNNLSEKTPIMQAIMYRGCEVPSGPENKEERRRIRKMKEFYELKSQREKREKQMLEEMEKEFL